MKRIMAVLAVSLLAGCAVAPQRDNYSIVDPKGVDPARYRQDYSECAALANQTDVGERAAGGAVGGALFGAVIGSLFCGRNCANQGAMAGAIGGVSGGVGGGVREQQVALRRCLAGRGYNVIR